MLILSFEKKKFMLGLPSLTFIAKHNVTSWCHPVRGLTMFFFSCWYSVISYFVPSLIISLQKEDENSTCQPWCYSSVPSPNCLKAMLNSFSRMSESSSLFYLTWIRSQWVFVHILVFTSFENVWSDRRYAKWVVFLFVCSNTVLIALEFECVAVLIEDTWRP